MGTHAHSLVLCTSCNKSSAGQGMTWEAAINCWLLRSLQAARVVASSWERLPKSEEEEEEEAERLTPTGLVQK